ncbi:MAG TPA: ABC transporter substrate-binding protein [Stellaceae bacterium]|nr:ABC transporter substrate-binding protein [Stellaceae bacterium]
MIPRRAIIIGLGTLALGAARVAGAGDQDASVAVIRGLYDTLLGVMKDGQRLGFAGRRDRLAPTIRRSFDFPQMTRLMVGTQWQQLAAEQRQQLITAFSAFSIATYANRFDDYSGEVFEVDDVPQHAKNGDDIVKSRLVKSDGEKVELDYLMRNDNGRRQIVDVYLSGTVSELATRRSEFASVIRRGGVDALLELLRRKTVELSG